MRLPTGVGFPALKGGGRSMGAARGLRRRGLRPVDSKELPAEASLFTYRRFTGWNLVPQLREAFAEPLDRNEPEGGRDDLSRQQWLPGTQSHRADLNDDLVQEAGVAGSSEVGAGSKEAQNRRVAIPRLDHESGRD